MTTPVTTREPAKSAEKRPSSGIIEVPGAATPIRDFGTVDPRISGKRPDRFKLSRLRRGANARLKRTRKYLWQRMRYSRTQPKTPAFILGCQRSGTTMLGEILDRSPETWVYPEGHTAATHYGRLRDAETVRDLIARSYAKAIVFKPIMDSHVADRILDLDDRGKAIWIYRRYADVANSAIHYWGDHQKDVLRWIRKGEWGKLGWRGERLSPEIVDRVGELFSEDMSAEDAAAFFWYLRNHFYFQLGLETNPRVLLVKYEDLVTSPEPSFSRVFRTLGCTPSQHFFSGVFATSVGKAPFAQIDPRIRELCDDLMTRLDETYQGMLAQE